MVKLPKVLGVQVKLPGIGDTIPNLLQLYNPLAMVPLLVKSFFGEEKEGSSIKEDGGGSETSDVKVSKEQNNVNGDNAEAVASETTYESGEGEVVFVPLKSEGGEQFMPNVKSRTYSTKSIKRTIDEVTLSMYAGK